MDGGREGLEISEWAEGRPLGPLPSLQAPIMANGESQGTGMGGSGGVGGLGTGEWTEDSPDLRLVLVTLPTHDFVH